MRTEPLICGDPRTVRARQSVLDTTVSLMVERGIHALTIDSIAERSGVAKTTIYRHWQNREAIILDALSSLAVTDVEAPTGTTTEQITVHAWRFAEKIGKPPWSVLLPDLLSLAGRSPSMRALYEDFLRSRRHPIVELIADTVSGFDTDTDAEVVALMILGSILYRQLVLLIPPDKTFVNQVVRAALDSCLSNASTT